MNQKENQERVNHSVEVEDLTVEGSAEQEVKGGPANTYTGVTTVNQGVLLIR